MEVIYKDETIEFSITYEKRKRIQIRVEYPGLVRVNAPKGTDEKLIKEIVLSNAEPISNKIKEMSAPASVLKEKTYVDGEEFLYLGKKLNLSIIVDAFIEKAEIKVIDNVLKVIISTDDKSAIKKALEKFYKKQCRKKIQKRIAFYQKFYKVKPKNVEIVQSNEIWGSCSSERNLRFNWRLMMAPEKSIDYIVVHEMCHLAHMNHSKSFWTYVGKVMPDYKERSKWLAINGGRMEL